MPRATRLDRTIAMRPNHARATLLGHARHWTVDCELPGVTMSVHGNGRDTLKINVVSGEKPLVTADYRLEPVGDRTRVLVGVEIDTSALRRLNRERGLPLSGNEAKHIVAKLSQYLDYADRVGPTIPPDTPAPDDAPGNYGATYLIGFVQLLIGASTPKE